MIVTRKWLEEYIDLSGVSNDELYKTFNRIGLEVDSIKEYKIPEKIVVGRIVACGKHPDADKLSLCQIDIGDGEPKQIICGAANVVDAEYVAVATIGAVLPDGLEIKEAKLRGVESYGMVCSSTELGLPKINDGIMILDDSIGELEIGRELGSYPDIADTVIELELTANRGDCLSIHGVARDLSAAFDRPLKHLETLKVDSTNIGIARKVSIRSSKEIPANLLYFLVKNDGLRERLLTQLRLAFVGLEIKGKIANNIKYSTHATGVVLRAYDATKLYDATGKITINIKKQGDNGLVRVASGDKELSIVGALGNDEMYATDEIGEILVEASYIEPTLLVEAVSVEKTKTDSIYYNTSRGSEPDLKMGATYFKNMCTLSGECNFYDGDFPVETRYQKRTVNVSIEALSSIIGTPVSKTTVHSILNRLGFEMRGGTSDTFGVHIPFHRHDIVNIQDIAEEILRMVGIDGIESKPLLMQEKNRITESSVLYHQKRDMRQRAVSAGFYEAVTYAFADRDKLAEYHFPVIEDSLELANPIVDELDTLRTTLLTNLLDALKRNISYGMKHIALFEIGAVFDSQRNQSDKIAFVWSGQKEKETVTNHGKPSPIDFGSFSDAISRVAGDLKFIECSEKNGLIHPYQSATVLKNGVEAGYITKLHPTIAKEYNLGATYVAELDLSPLLPRHILAHHVSNYQGVYKDISVVVDKNTPYILLSNALDTLENALLKKHYVVDVYEDESLGNMKSVTIRLFVQSDAGTLSESEIEDTVGSVFKILEDKCQATLR